MLVIEITQKMVDDQKVREVFKRKNYRSLEHAAAFLRKYIRRSIEKRSGRKKTYDLKAFFPSKKGGTDLVDAGKMSDHLARPTALERVVAYRGRRKGDDIVPKAKDVYVSQKASQPGATPYSWKSYQPGWKDYYIRDSIKYDVDESKGVANVFSNPHAYGKKMSSASVPQLLERGGSTIARRRWLEGYKITRWGKRLLYKCIWKYMEKRIAMKSRPFLKPALMANLKDIPEKWRSAVVMG